MAFNPVKGKCLDKWAEVYGLKRKPFKIDRYFPFLHWRETDRVLRGRILDYISQCETFSRQSYERSIKK